MQKAKIQRALARADNAIGVRPKNGPTTAQFVSAIKALREATGALSADVERLEAEIAAIKKG